MKYFPTLFFIFIASVSVAAPATVTVQHLIENGPYLKKVLDQAGSAKVLKYYIFDQPDSSFEKAFMPYACYFESEIEKKALHE